MSNNYLLRVTAGATYALSSHQVVPVNSPEPISIESEHLQAEVNVRIKSYHGLPLSTPSTSSYFSHPPHAQNQDRYSISFTFALKSSMNGNDLVFGNDLDHPVRDHLPPGLNVAFRIAKWFVDPGLEGDFYADRPYLYSPLGSGLNALYIEGLNCKGGKSNDPNVELEGLGAGAAQGGIMMDREMGLRIEEGGDEMGMKIRREKGVPSTEAARRKHFLNETARKNWVWEADVKYGCDFFNPYLDFDEFALRLPGFTLHVISYWDGQPLRYVLKNRLSDEELLVIQFTLYLKEDIDERGNIKQGVTAGLPLCMMAQGERDKHTDARRKMPMQNKQEKGEEQVERNDSELKSVIGAFEDDGGVD